MAFQNHSIRDAEWGSYKRIPGADTQYPAITAQVTDRQEFSGGSTTFDVIDDRFAQHTENTRDISANSQVSQKSVGSTSVAILDACSNRKGYTVHNAHASATVYLHEGSASAATTANATAFIVAGDVYKPTIVWTGEVKAITAGTTVTLNVTDYCPPGEPVAPTPTTTTTSTTTTSTTSTTTTSTSTSTTTCDPNWSGLLDHYTILDCADGTTQFKVSDTFDSVTAVGEVHGWYDSTTAFYKCGTIVSMTTEELCEEAGDGDIAGDGDMLNCVDCNDFYL